MKNFLTVCYGAVAYLLFLVTFLYLVGFVGDIMVPRSVDHALSAPIGQAVWSTCCCSALSASNTA